MDKNINQEIQKLEALISATTDDKVKKVFEKRLQELKEKKTVTVDNDFTALIQSIDNLIDKTYQGTTGASPKEIAKIVKDAMDNFKVKEANLSPEVKNLIGQTTKVNVLINNVSVSDKQQDQRRLMDVLLSDVEAMNNVYLYGPAGTGKSFTAETLADKINYKLIELNCNQFTSPLDIIGGQTIEGYQEGSLTRAWGNIDLGVNPDGRPYDGAILLLDELPKLDPNTAGVLNAALAKIKNPVKNGISPAITNGRGETIRRKKIFVIATGNSLLNESNKDYEANFKQDLSLQDRFVGSCYLINYNYKFEYEKIMTNITTEQLPSVVIDMTFAFNFLAQLRMKILEKGLTGVAFVSTRLMIVMRDTFVAYIVNREQKNRIPNPKTIQDVLTTFLLLFPIAQREELERSLADEIKEFNAKAEAKNKAKLEDLNDVTDEQKQVAQLIIETAEAEYRRASGILL